MKNPVTGKIPSQQAAETFFTSISGLLAKYPLQVDVSGRSSILELHSLKLGKEFRGMGIGSEVIRKLTAAADTHQVPIELEVGFDEAEIDLLAFYSRHGFIWMDGYMHREPNPVTTGKHITAKPS